MYCYYKGQSAKFLSNYLSRSYLCLLYTLVCSLHLANNNTVSTECLCIRYLLVNWS